MAVPFKWQCGRCKRWNTIEDGVCKDCKGIREETAGAYQFERALTGLEKGFYEGTAVHILNELRMIRQALERKP